jgi:hypothetical protein
LDGRPAARASARKAENGANRETRAAPWCGLFFASQVNGWTVAIKGDLPAGARGKLYFCHFFSSGETVAGRRLVS